MLHLVSHNDLSTADGQLDSLLYDHAPQGRSGIQRYHERLCALPKHEIPQLGEPVDPLYDRQDVVPGQVTRLARKPRWAIRKEELGLAHATGIKQYLARQWIDGGALGGQWQVPLSQWDPCGLSAPSRLNDLRAQRKQCAQQLTTLWSEQILEPGAKPERAGDDQRI